MGIGNFSAGIQYNQMEKRLASTTFVMATRALPEVQERSFSVAVD
jgi:hypothetical protein